MVKSFEAQVKERVRQYKRRMRYIFNSSVQELAERCQTPQPGVGETGGSFETGKIPVDEGELINSFVSGLNGGVLARGKDAYVLSIANSKLGDSIFGGWTAPHALAMEYGTGSIAPRAYLRQNTAAWQQIVNKYARKSGQVWR